MSTCSVRGCERDHSGGRGLCKLHYKRWRKTGDPLGVAVRALPFEVRFWVRLAAGEPDVCWPWPMGRDKAGYGLVRNRKTLLAHRVAWSLTHGEIPDGLTVDHLCRNRACCNPAHMELVTRGENTLRGDTITARNRAKTECMRGHPFDEVNTRNLKGGGRVCRRCMRDYMRRRRAAQRLSGVA